MSTERPMEIVVVNDDVVQLRVIGDVLRSAGYRVRTYSDPEVALTSLVSGPRPDALVLDLYMPVIDGWRFCRYLRAGNLPHLQDLPILVASATFAGIDVRMVTAAFGADGFMEIPFDPAELVEVVGALADGVRHRPLPRAVYVTAEGAPPSDELGNAMLDAGYSFETRLHSEPWRLGLPPAVVFVDTAVPNAFELMEEVSGGSNTSVLIAAAESLSSEDFLAALKAGADAALTKPLRPTDVLQLVGETAGANSLLRVYDALQHRTEELRSSERRYRSLFEAVPESLILIDRDGVVLTVNREAQRRMMEEGEQVVGRHIREIVHPSSVETFEACLEQVWRDGFGTAEMSIQATKGEPREFSITARIADFKGTPCLLAVARDVTERRRLEMRVGQTQKLESLGVLASGMAHDFNNLLASILGNTGLAMSDLRKDHAAVESLAEIEVAARRAAELTTQILDYSGQRKVSVGPVDLSDLVVEMTRLMEPAVSKKARLDLTTASDLPSVNGNSSQIRQVVMNLITNASDALLDGPGEIHVRTGSERLTPQSLLDRRFLWNEIDPGTYVYVEVEDQGCGMDLETQNRIFDPFFTTKASGRGLGLAATLGAIRSHEGTVLLESRVGHGSRFRVYLPAGSATASALRVERQESTAEIPSVLPLRTADISGGTVLVVDDEPSVRRVVGTVLSRAGFRVLSADGGPSAIEIVREEEGAIDVAVVDLLMPDLDGVETLARLREMVPELPAVVCSGFASDDVMQRVEADPRSRFIGKPYRPDELVGAVQAWYAAAQASAGSVPLLAPSAGP